MVVAAHCVAVIIDRGRLLPRGYRPNNKSLAEIHKTGNSRLAQTLLKGRLFDDGCYYLNQRVDNSGRNRC